MTPRLDAWAAVMGVSGPVGNIATGGRLPSPGTAGLSAPDATEAVMAGLPFCATAWVEGGGTADAAGAPVADWEGEVAVAVAVAGDVALNGVAQPVSHTVMAKRQVDVNFIGMGLGWR